MVLFNTRVSRGGGVCLAGLTLVGVGGFAYWESAQAEVRPPIDAVIQAATKSAENYAKTREAVAAVDRSSSTRPDAEGAKPGRTDSPLVRVASGQAGDDYAVSEPANSTTPGIYAALTGTNLAGTASLDESLERAVKAQLPFELTPEDFKRLLGVSSKIVAGIVRSDFGLDQSKVPDSKIQEISGAVAVVYKQAEFLYLAQTTYPNIKSIADLSVLTSEQRANLAALAQSRTPVDRAIFGSAMQGSLVNLVKTLTEQQIPVSEWARMGIF